MPNTFRLFADGLGQFVPPEQLSDNLPQFHEVRVGNEIKKYPLGYMWKDVLLPGTFGKHSTGQTLTLSKPRLEKVLNSTKSYLKNGNPCPIPFKDHNETTNAGFVVDARIRGDRLQLLHQFIGEKMVEAALQNHVSVMFKSHFRDPKGNTYEDVITHSSLTDDPVIIGQEQWSSLAASRGESADAPLLVFAASGSSFMNLAKLRKLLGLADDVADDVVLAKAEEKLGTIPALETEKTNLTTQLSQKNTELTTVKSELDTKKQEVVTLSQNSKQEKPTAQSLYFAKSAFSAKRDALVAAGTLSKAAATKIEEHFVGKDKLGTITLSKTVTDDDIALCAGIARGLETLEVLEGVQAGGPKSGDDNKTSAQDPSQTVPNKKAGESSKEEDDKDKKDKPLTISQTAVKAGTARYAMPAKRQTQPV